MPSSKNYKRDYSQERKTAIARGETSSGSSSSDAMRHRARRAVTKKLGHPIPEGMQVDHKVPLKSSKTPSSNSLSNLRLRSTHSNESAGGKSGNRKGKAAGGRKGK